MGEIASHGYFIVADGTPGSTAANGSGTGTALLAYITWAIAENDKPCSAYYQSLDTTKIAADGFSCGGLMSENASGDPRFTAIGITSSGLFSADQNLYKKIHTPFKILLGGTGDMAYTNGERDYTSIAALGVPILLLSKDGAGHGGDLFNAKGDFNTVNLAWLNWQLKGDETATGKALLVGSSCKYCNASGWEFKSANLP
jgi:dienelactone hydrolase